MFVVRDSRYAAVAMFALAIDAYAERNTLARKTGKAYTVSFVPSYNSIRSQIGFDLSDHLTKVTRRK